MLKWRKSFMHNKAKTYTVYVHENSTNGKVYIGITSQKPENRWRNGKGYLTGYTKKTPFANAIMKYGWENFSHHIVLSGISQERANRIEQNLIRVFNSTDRSKGYNLSHGGGGVTGFTVDEVERKARSERMKGAKFSDETRRKMSEAKNGYVPWNRGKHTGFTEKQTAARRKRCRNVKTVDGVFDTVSECAKFYGVGRKTLSDWLSGKRKPSKKYEHIQATYL